MTQPGPLNDDEYKQLEDIRAALDELLQLEHPHDRQQAASRLQHLAMDAGILAGRLARIRPHRRVAARKPGRLRTGWTRWNTLVPGDKVLARRKRGGGEPVEVTIQTLLDRDLADGAGFVGADGVIYRQFYFDVAHLLEDD